MFVVIILVAMLCKVAVFLLNCNLQQAHKELELNLAVRSGLK